ncbi:DUF1559 family PulG-like putative transporter [Allorhodopirellula heiligendammensis]|uniref:DUF1559 family PulG-like putative transporter n=1 Tax=Allorhodopirellula heiligendammensis TaxID=2714739 RepID=UPI0011B4C50B|nr:DUF1559 domain-containing protein [Allorhodopirellula heiligendammensis]
MRSRSTIAGAIAVLLSGNHQGGVQTLRFDGSVRFVTDSVDAGNANLPQVKVGKSPYGIWGAMGSPQGSETVTLD